MKDARGEKTKKEKELNSQKKTRIIAFICLLGNYNEVVINYKQQTKQKIIFRDQQYGK